MTTAQTTEYRDYGYRAWEDVRVGDYVQSDASGRMLEVVSVEPIAPEYTATGSADYVRVVLRVGRDHVISLARVSYHFTTVYYRVDRPAIRTLECGCVLGKYRAEKLCRYHQDEDDAIYQANQARRMYDALPATDRA